MPRFSHPKLLSFLLLTAVLVAGLWGCSDDPATTPSNSEPQQTGVLSANNLRSGGANFEVATNPSGDPNQPARGPFRLRGTNLHYDNALQALVVDLTAINRGADQFNEPVTLTFLALMPDSVTVLNPDNDQHGAGAQILFAFADSDLVWSPDEESLPRTVQFGVAAGTSIAFVARIDVGVTPGAGAIGGVVFNDADEDGVMDPEEAGIGGAVVHLIAEGAETRSTSTHDDGTYRFDDLAAGVYTVSKAADPNLHPTTPTELTVLLVADENGDVSDFLAANFGCTQTPPDNGGETIEVGDHVDVTGSYAAPADSSDTEGHRIVADTIVVEKHENDDDEDDDSAGSGVPPQTLGQPSGHDGPPPMWVAQGWLAGPITAIDLDAHSLDLMGTQIFFLSEDDAAAMRLVPLPGAVLPPAGLPRLDFPAGNDLPEHDWDLKLEDVQVGDRVAIRIRETICPVCERLAIPLLGLRMREWKGEPEKAVGRVSAVDSDSDPSTGATQVTGFTVLGTHIEITKATVIRFESDDDEDDDD